MPEKVTRLGKGGRVVIPSPYRKALGLKTGDPVILQLEGVELRILTPREALARAQAMVRPYLHRRKTLVEELTSERRREAPA